MQPDALAHAAARWSLTPAQHRVLSALASGATNHAIAASLGCSLANVEYHLANLFRAARVTSRAELLAALYSSPTAPSPTADAIAAALSRPWRLTPQQRTVLTLLLRGSANKDIALALSCSVSNAEARVRDLLRKSSSPTRAALIARCLAAFPSASPDALPPPARIE